MMIDLSKLCRAAPVALAIALGACTYLTPYKLEIQQGSVVTQENVNKLKVGMTRSQVSYVMGTPLLADAFHANRWDYVYYLRKRERVVDQRKVVLLFDGDVLKDIRSDLPAERDATAPKAVPAPAATPAPAASNAAPAQPAAAASVPVEKDAPPAVVTPAPEALDVPTPSAPGGGQQ